VGAIDAAAVGPFKKYAPTATDEKTRKVFSVLVEISVVCTIFGKSFKLLLPNVIF